MPLALQKILDEKKDKDSFRELKSSSQPIDFCSNDYLGLARSPGIILCYSTKCRKTQATLQWVHRFAIASGNSELAEEVEKKLAGIFHAPKSLLFNSGYTANLAVLSCCPGVGTPFSTTNWHMPASVTVRD